MRIFIGIDPRQAIAYSVASFSVIRNASRPVSIHPLVLDQLPLQRRGLTEFTFTRFLVPYQCQFKGWALWMDSDIVCTTDVHELMDYADPDYAVMAVDTNPKFERSAVMLFNCAHPDNEILTPEFIETAEGLHGLNWTGTVGALPNEWNHLIGYNRTEEPWLDNSGAPEPRPTPKMLHFTKGIPVWPEVAGCEYAANWHGERRKMCSVVPSWAEMMGQSVHEPKWEAAP